MKILSNNEIQIISGGVNFERNICVATIVTLYALIGYVLATSGRTATKEEEEFYFMMQCMHGFGI